MRGLRLLAVGAIVLAAMLASRDGQNTRAVAQSSSCRSTCLAQYNQCRIATKGSPSCDAQYQACLQACVGQGHR